MKASAIKITTEEMKKMYDAICKYKADFPDTVMEFTNRDDYTRRTLKRMAQESHGDCILVDEYGNELHREMAVPPGEPKI